MTSSMKGIVIDPERDGQRFKRGSGEGKGLREISLLVNKELIGSEQFVGGLATFPPGVAAPPHVHPDAEEITIVWEGEGNFTTPDGTQHIKEGDWQFIPRGVEHSHKNVGKTPFTIVWLYSPPTTSAPK